MWGEGAPRGWPAQAALTIGDPVTGGTNNCVLYIDAGGNLACDSPFIYNGADVLSIGKTFFEAWTAGYSVLQIGGNTSIMCETAPGVTAFRMLHNTYYNGNWRYVNNGEASYWYQVSGTSVFDIAVSGVADAVITWYTAVRIPNHIGGGFSIAKTTWENWGTTYSVLQIGGNASLLSTKTEAAGNIFNNTMNAYLDGGGTWRYISNDEVSRYEQSNGTHTWYVAGSGAADAAITWIGSMTINAGGDTYWIGAGTGLLYGSAQTGTTNIAWAQVAAQNTWYEISDADIVDGDLNGITHDGSGKLTCPTAQIYDAIGIITISSSIASKHVETTFSINGVPRTTRGIQHIDIPAANSEVVIPIADELDLSANDTVEIAVRTTDAGNPTLTVDHLTLKLTGIGGT